MIARSEQPPRSTSKMRRSSARKHFGRQDDDIWPATEDEQDELIVWLSDRARELLRRHEDDPVRLDLVVDAVSDELMNLRTARRLPRRPRAWFLAVAFRLVNSDALPRSRTVQLTWEPALVEHQEQTGEHRAWLLGHLEEIGARLTSRQMAVLRACLTNNSLAAAAAAVHEHPSNFGRAVEQVGSRVRAHFFPLCTQNPY
jgi:hypothetical protein